MPVNEALVKRKITNCHLIFLEKEIIDPLD